MVRALRICEIREEASGDGRMDPQANSATALEDVKNEFGYGTEPCVSLVAPKSKRTSG